ncbi:cora-domain-containing protein [Phlegmacium glaucopus]|nr:cora-domain-containing protein [Phlegmacium glaucopus]
MSTPPVLSSSPVSIRNASPVRRRSVSPGDLADLSSRAPHHSPAIRSFNPNDPQVRERQRTMDVDMAMQLSLARRDTLHPSPVSVFATPATISSYDANQPSADHTFPPLPIQEEDTIPDFEQGGASDVLTNMQDSLSIQTHFQGNTEDVTASNFGLPTYQAGGPLSSFDFARMEEFATAEKATLGFNSPTNARFSLSAIRGRPKANEGHSSSKPMGSTVTPLEEATVLPETAPSGEDGPSSDQPLQRHRKLSQSNPYPRSHRKGIGGKMALFENTSTDAPSFSARLGLSLGVSDGDIPSGPSHNFISGIPGAARPTGGILNTGHDRPYRFSFYSNALSATIHARSLSELPADGQTFEQLFSGRPASQPYSPPYQETNKTSSNLSDNTESGYFPNNIGFNGNSNRRVFLDKTGGPGGTNDTNVLNADQDTNTWWLDVQSPTDEEMKMLSKVFSIHPLTTEDILMEETREKIELFRNYYLVCFRSFDQDPYSPTHLEPLNMYIIVFREGILSFHFRPTPHPQNVRRRIKQLKDYISVTSDWISYALIDDITDAFGPLIQSIEYEVDSIDELVLILEEAEQSDMLRRIGTCRKKVMGLLRLMGNKADVVKGLAKRCNENWRVAPTSDIGLYLSDIQDHLITMTQNLNHYEKILSRSHSNYLAQISIEMTEANNQINDVLSKLTALGTVLIPMNLVTGLWGMNVHVPGQDVSEVDLFLPRSLKASNFMMLL